MPAMLLKYDKLRKERSNSANGSKSRAKAHSLIYVEEKVEDDDDGRRPRRAMKHQ